MEEVISVVVQVFIEVVLQVFGGLVVDAVGAATTPANKEQEKGCWWLVLMAVVGGVMGRLSLLVVPQLFLPNTALRIANLVVAPVAASGLGYAAGRLLFRGDEWGHFGRGFVFALLFGLVRFAYAAK